MNRISITVLVDNISSEKLESEHGLSLWIEYGDRHILFDTGRSDLLLKNAKRLDIDLTSTDALVISHGHYDHTGGLLPVLDMAAKAKLYLHPGATEPKFSCKTPRAHWIGMSEAVHRALYTRPICWTVQPALLFPGAAVTGQVPRVNNYEDVGGAFFLDKECQEPDLLPDDQALVLASPRGLIVVFGCAHAGVVNTVAYISELAGQEKIYAVVGGMHLLNANRTRIDHTIETLRKYKV
jgi:7,8-dihydropterin-6-yl-methyl-4-(beta-D-ribofuranosyl)aminobenzene 5'-phosphate synthase